MNILLFGAPGAGKGTQSALLVENHGMHHISTGDLFRHAIKNSTQLGLEAKKYMDKGELVPDTIVVGMVEEEFGNLKGKSFILDGFPRTVPQAEALESMLKNNSMAIDKAVFLEVPQGLLMERLTGRRICKACGAVFHMAAKPPKSEGVCDECGGELYQRDDDKAEVIKTRLEAYEASTAPLKAYYEEKGRLVTVEGTGETAQVFDRIDSVMKA
ncbi:MAG: adenylate kinase [Bdellovibrionaceae bacterium]|nr:adenylate kinase [Bdellovibrionales bacterium]MCB9084652.1 adenylate kinase [Pseudobdellovibrionaceae bacterium]